VEQLEYCRMGQLKKSTVEPLEYYSMCSCRVHYSIASGILTVKWCSQNVNILHVVLKSTVEQLKSTVEQLEYCRMGS
jgi:hypothetical protein